MGGHGEDMPPALGPALDVSTLINVVNAIFDVCLVQEKKVSIVVIDGWNAFTLSIPHSINFTYLLLVFILS